MTDLVENPKDRFPCVGAQLSAAVWESEKLGFSYRMETLISPCNCSICSERGFKCQHEESLGIECLLATGCCWHLFHLFLDSLMNASVSLSICYKIELKLLFI